MRGLTGPAIVITIGVLFLLHEVADGRFDFGSTWPVLLVVVGLLQLASSFASREGHVDAQPPLPGVPPQPPGPPANPAQTFSASREQ
jgi:hypothetical protein